MRTNRLRARQDMQKRLMYILPLLKIILFSFVPMVGLVIAFQSYKPALMFGSPFVGFDNFKVVFGNPDLFSLITNAVLMNVYFVVFGTLVSMVLALFLFEFTNKFFIKFNQTAYFLPYFVAWPVVGMLVMALLGTNGMLTNTLQALFGVKIDFYSRPKLWRGIMTFIYVWKSAGTTMITYYAVLINTDKEVYEAADIDGASRFQKMRYISLSNLTMMICIGIIMSCGNIIRMDFSMNFFIIGSQSLLYPTVDVLESYIYRALISTSNFGNLTAMGLFQGVVGLVMSLAANYVIRKIDRNASVF